MSNKNFVEQHYARHAKHFENDLVDAERIRISESWFDESTADHWRHARSYECAELLVSDLSASWLTVGDGRWGLDAMRLRKKGFTSVLASDISEALLRAAKDRGLIDSYAVENAEKLTFTDKSFDYVFCKEALHHFPRPYAALYEMLRVARKGVFIIEPNDTYEFAPPAEAAALAGGVRGLLARLRYVLRGHQALARTQRPEIRYNPPDWEGSGNYVYGISRREIEKIALGLNLPQIAVKGLNDHYVKGCEFEPADEGRSVVFRELVGVIRGKDELCRQGLADSNLVMAGIFLQAMDDVTRRRFFDAGWMVTDLPANPYIPRGN